MFGWRLVSESELAMRSQMNETRIASLAADLRAAKDYAAKCERLIERERERFEKEQSRADRISDAVFQSNGLPPASDALVREQRAQEDTAAKKQLDHMAELMEIWSETESDLTDDGAAPLPEEIAETVK
jgi:hypothetical protein